MARWDQKGYEEAGSPKINPKEKKGFDTEYAEMAGKLVAAGANQKDLAFVFGTSEGVIREWKRDHKEFKNAINRGKELTLARLIGAGIQSAEGTTVETITVTEKHTVLEDGTIGGLTPGTVVDVKKETKNLPPNEKMIQFLASTLSRQLKIDDWVSKQFTETKVSGEVKHKIDASMVAKQIAAQAGNLTKYVDSTVVQDIIEGEIE